MSNIDHKKTPILIPCLNPSEVLIDLVDGLIEIGFTTIYVVNDGSGPEFDKIFSQLSTMQQVHLLKHEVNKGKGAALKTGINAIVSAGHLTTGVITFDADGQHLKEDLLKIAVKAETNPDDFILGTRDFSGDIPFRSKIGNSLTVSILSFLYRLAVEDSQTGLRYLPKSLLPHIVALPGSRYEFELECLLEAHRLSYPIVQVPIQTVYIDGNKSSHFNPVVDSFRVYKVLAKFSLSSIICFGIDILLFSIIFMISQNVLLATFFARSISGVSNFLLNKSVVFSVWKSDRLKTEIFGYFILWLVIAFASAFAVSSLGRVFETLVIPLKILVDLCLFFVSYFVQKTYVFGKPNLRHKNN